MTKTLFQLGSFTLHSGLHADWKIDCDALSDEDMQALAFMLVGRVAPFGFVYGIPRGGERLAAALRQYCTGGALLIVDDVLTTGRSMEEARESFPLLTRVLPAIGGVIFSRKTHTGPWITPIFTMNQWVKTRLHNDT